MFALYAMKIEYTDIYDDPTNLSAQSFHDIFGMFSDDGGATWSQPVNLTKTAESGEENFFIYAYDRVVGGKIHAVWQQDTEPGHFNEGDPITTNNIKYNAWDIESFYPTLPTAFFTSVSDIGEVTFTNLSEDATGCYTWDFGDGATSNESDPVHTYLVADTYTVCLTAENPYGTDEYCTSVNVILPPDAAFSFVGDPVVTFTDLTLNSPTSWAWDFGDGGSSTLQNPVHTFTADNTYTVCLTATNALGFEVYCLPVVIDSTELLAPGADFSFVLLGGGTVEFTDLSTNEPTAWAWDFGDGGTSSDQNPSHAYAVTDVAINACLIASNDFGSDTICKQVFTNAVIDISQTLQVYPNPASAFVIVATENWQPEIVRMFDITGATIPVEYSPLNQGTLQFNTSQIPAGIYTIELRDDQRVGFVRCVIE
jgi:PKD repeat protein